MHSSISMFVHSTQMTNCQRQLQLRKCRFGPSPCHRLPGMKVMLIEILLNLRLQSSINFLKWPKAPWRLLKKLDEQMFHQ